MEPTRRYSSQQEDAWRRMHLAAFFHNPKVVEAVARQLQDALSPFDRFLKSSVRVARERQVRLELPWSPVPEEKVLELEPLDTLIEVPIQPPAWIIRGWGNQPLPEDPLIFVDPARGQVKPTAIESNGEDLHLQLPEDISEARMVFWDSKPVTLERPQTCEQPTEIRSRDGEIRPVVHVRRDEDRWLVVVEGANFQPAEGVVLDALLQARELHDEHGRHFEARQSALTAETPEGPLRSSEGVRFNWKLRTRQKSRGVSIQLKLPDDNETEELIDPRANFCEAEPEYVWTERRYRPERTIKVLWIDRENYRLRLERLPDKGQEPTLFLPLDLRGLELQRRALNQLRTAPLPHMAGLVHLCEDPERSQWGLFQEEWPDEWFVLTDESRSGTQKQREFVARSLGTPDLAVMEGPPGSGKTTVIVELAMQFAKREQRVLFISNTNVAVDNVVERLLEHSAGPEVVRLGNPDRTDSKVKNLLLDEKVETLLKEWQSNAILAELSEDDLKKAATRIVMDTAEIVCVTMGSLPRLPWLKEAAERDDRSWKKEPWAQPVVFGPAFDVLIIDEVSKTLVPEFFLAALLAPKHVIVGDIRQLPPFTDRDALEANLDALITDEGGRQIEVANVERQRAAFIRFLLEDNRWWNNDAVRFLVVEPEGVLHGLACELECYGSEVVRIRQYVSRRADITEISVSDLLDGKLAALYLYTAKVVLLPKELVATVAQFLPGDLQLLGDRQTCNETPFPFRMDWWKNHAHSALGRTIRIRGQKLTSPSAVGKYIGEMLSRRTWAKEVAWRISRRHELRRATNSREGERLTREIETLMPRGVPGVPKIVQEVADVGLPSVLEVIQVGLRGKRTRRQSSLVDGMTRGPAKEAFENRFVRLEYQHRMHPGISDLPRKLFYEDSALRDANTIEQRDSEIQWDWGPKLFGNFRRIWLDVRGEEHRGINAKEVKAAMDILVDFTKWAARHGKPPLTTHPTGRWTVALLSFYSRQMRALAEEMRLRCRQPQRHTRFEWPNVPVEIIVGTVDRFQGREADLVVLSFRNNRRIGFLDSPNRLNVAITRAKQHLVLIGRYEFFQRLKADVRELAELAENSKKVSGFRLGRAGDIRR